MSTLGGSLSQIPMPPAELWVQFAVVGIIALALIVAAIGLFTFIKWFWKEYKATEKERRDFEAQQNALREEAQNKRDERWMQMIAENEARRNKNDERRDERLSENMRVLDRHDEQAKQILVLAQDTDEKVDGLGHKVGALDDRVGKIEPRVEQIWEAVKPKEMARTVRAK